MRTPDPRRLDVARFVAAAGRLDGALPVARLARLASMLAAPAGEVAWRLEGRPRAAAGGAVEAWLAVTARAEVALACQRCLEPVRVALHVERALRFARDEAEAERLDAELDDDVLALEPALDALTLVEDELLLALPLVPRHEACALPSGGAAHADAGDAADAAPAPHPFAALASLKRRDGDV